MLGTLDEPLTDVTRVIHWGVPDNEVWFWQEIGRYVRFNLRLICCAAYHYKFILILCMGSLQCCPFQFLLGL